MRMNKMKKIEIKRKIFSFCSILCSITAMVLCIVSVFSDKNLILQAWVLIASSILFSWLVAQERCDKLMLYWDAEMDESLLYLRAILEIKRYAVFAELPADKKQKLNQYIDLQYEGARKQVKEIRKEKGIILTEIKIDWEKNRHWRE